MMAMFASDMITAVGKAWTKEYNKTLEEFKILKELKKPTEEDKERLRVLDQRLYGLKQEARSMAMSIRA